MAKLLLKTHMSTLYFSISKLSEFCEIKTPEFIIHGIPWKMHIYKCEEENALAVFLLCMKKGDSWEVPACFKMYLLPFNNKEPRVQHTSPFVFHKDEDQFGLPEFIKWDELLSDENEFVKNDTIELKIEVKVENPNNSKRAALTFETIDKSCNCGSLAVFQLTVKNIENLMAVHSPQFNLRGLPWDFAIHREQKDTLGIILFAKKSNRSVPCMVTMTVKLLSTENNDVETFHTAVVQRPGSVEIEDIIPWGELMKPENGFVNNNSITLEVEIKAIIPKSNAPRRSNGQKRPYSSV